MTNAILMLFNILINAQLKISACVNVEMDSCYVYQQNQ